RKALPRRRCACSRVPEAVAVPGAFGPPVLAARMRARLADVEVDELDGLAPDGAGGPRQVARQKRARDPAFAAQRIARWAGVPDVAVGHAGLKDRHAVTRQRFSVHLPGREAPDVASLEGEGLRVLAQARHRRKLPRGALAGNRFAIVLRDVQ